jgi:predicted Zn-dependent protease
MRLHYLLAALVVLLALGFSLLMLPRGQEVALMRLRDKEFGQARTAYEQRYAGGDHSAATTMALTRLYLQTGDIGQTILLMEDLEKREPGSLEVHELLGTLYQYAQRPGDYVRNLETIATLKPSLKVLKELSAYYNYTADYPRQTAILQRMVQVFPEEIQPRIDLAYLLASDGQITEAAEHLLQADEASKGKGLDETGRQTLASMLLDLGRPDDALLRVQRWLEGRKRLDEVSTYASLFARAHRADLAVALIAPYTRREIQSPELEMMLADLESAAGQPDAARARLTALQGHGRLPPAALGDFIDRALTLGLVELALAEAQRQDPAAAGDRVLADLAEAAFRKGNLGFVVTLRRRIGDDFLARRPALGAEIALAAGDRAEAGRWLARAMADDGLPAGERLAAAQHFLALGDKAAAGRLLDRIDRGPTFPEDSLGPLAELIIELGRVDGELSWFESRRERQPSAAADAGWARLAVRSGRSAELLLWLADKPDRPGALLEDLARAAIDQGAAALALALTSELYRRGPSPRHSLDQAQALILNQRADEALPLIRPLLPGGPEEKSAYIAALDASGRTGELAAWWQDELARGSLGDAEQATILYGLIDRRQWKVALPFLRERARRLGGEWLFAYADAAGHAQAGAELAELLAEELQRPELGREALEQRVFLLIATAPERALAPLARLAEAEPAFWWNVQYQLLRQLGRKDEIGRLMAARAADPRLPAEQRRQIAYAALDEGNKAAALIAFQRLAETSGPGGADMSQVAYLWGPRPGPAAQDWLIARSRAAASGEECGGWLEHLNAIGGAPRVVAYLATLDRPPAGPLLPPAIAAFAAVADRAQLEAAIRLAVVAEHAPERLRTYAQLAEAARAVPVADLAWRALLRERPDDAGALRQVGMIAYDQSHLADALHYLRRYTALQGGDYEANYFLGEVLTARKQPYEAARSYRQALAQLQATAGAPSDRNSAARRPAAQRMIEANLLNRLGRVNEAVAVYRDLRQRRPGDLALTADLAQMLIENGRFQEGSYVLALR